MEYKISKHSVYNINYHIVFCPKRRKPVLVDELCNELKYIIQENVNKCGGKIESLAIMPDHVHIFVSCPPTISPHVLVKNIKGRSAKILREMFPNLKKMPALWSRSYYVGTVGFVSESVIKNYIDSQKGK